MGYRLRTGTSQILNQLKNCRHACQDLHTWYMTVFLSRTLNVPATPLGDTLTWPVGLLHQQDDIRVRKWVTSVVHVQWEQSYKGAVATQKQCCFSIHSIVFSGISLKNLPIIRIWAVRVQQWQWVLTERFRSQSERQGRNRQIDYLIVGKIAVRPPWCTELGGGGILDI